MIFSQVMTQIYVLIKVNEIIEINENFSTLLKEYFNFGFNYFSRCYHTLIYIGYHESFKSF